MKIGIQTTDVMTEKYPQTEENPKLTVTEKQGPGENRRLSESLEDRIRFETLISDISARFVNISPDQVDPEINRALKQPEIRFDVISSSTGIETIEKARNHAR